MSELINKPVTNGPVTNGPVTGELVAERPSYLMNREVPMDKIAAASEHVRPPRVKFIQGLTKEPYKPPFTEGQAILVPQMKLLCDKETPMVFTVLYFYPEFLVMNPHGIEDTFIKDRSLDRGSTIAKKCAAFVNEPNPSGKKGEIKYRKSLNFIMLIHDVPEIRDMPVVMSFKSGQSGQKLIMNWSSRGADWFACRFRGVVATEQGKQNDWWGLATDNDPIMFVPETDFFRYEKMALHLEKLVLSKELQVDHDDEDVVDGTVNRSSAGAATESKF